MLTTALPPASQTTLALRAPSSTTIKPEQDDLTFCRGFLVSLVTAETQTRFENMGELELSEPPKAADDVPSPESPRLLLFFGFD